MMLSGRAAAATLVLSLLFAGIALAAIPTQAIPFTGRLALANGSAITQAFNFTFNIYSVFSGGAVLWNYTTEIQPTANGIVYAELNISLPFDQRYWLEVVVNGTTLSPRRELGVRPWAIIANTSDNLGKLPSSFFQNGTEQVTTGLPASNITGLDNSHAHDAANVSTGTLSTSRLAANVSMLGQTIEDNEVDNDITIDTTKDARIRGNLFVNGTIYTVNLTSLNQSNINVNGSFYPSFDSLFDLGSSALRWLNVFAVTINATTLLGDLQGTWFGLSTNFFQNGTELVTTSLPAGNITGLTNSHLHDASNITGTINAQQLGGQTSNFYRNTTEPSGGSPTTSLPAANITSGQFSGLFNFSSNVFVLGVLNVTGRINGTIDCSSIVGGGDSDFCNDATGSGAPPTTSLPASNITSGTFTGFYNFTNIIRSILFTENVNVTDYVNSSRIFGNLLGTFAGQDSNFFQNGTELVTTSLPASNITGLNNSHFHDASNITGTISAQQLGGQSSNFFQNGTELVTTGLPADNITSGTFSGFYNFTNIIRALFLANSVNATDVINATRIFGNLLGTFGGQNTNFFINGTLPVNDSQRLGGQASNFYQNGTELVTTNLPAENITSGTLDDRRLSTNVTFLNRNQTVIGDTNFTGAVRINSLLSGTNITGAVPNSNQLGGQNSNFYQNGTELVTTSLPADNITSGTFSGFYNFTNIIRSLLFANNVNATDALNATRIFGDLLGTFGGQRTNFFQNGTELVTTQLPASNVTGNFSNVTATDFVNASRYFGNLSAATFPASTCAGSQKVVSITTSGTVVCGIDSGSDGNVTAVNNLTGRVNITEGRGIAITNSSNQIQINSTLNESGIERVISVRLTATLAEINLSIPQDTYNYITLSAWLNMTGSAGSINMTFNSDGQPNYATYRITGITVSTLASARGIVFENLPGTAVRNRTLEMTIFAPNQRAANGRFWFSNQSNTVAAPIQTPVDGSFVWVNSTSEDVTAINIKHSTGAAVFAPGSWVIIKGERS